MLIRPLEERDTAAIASIEKETFGDHAWSQNLFLEEIQDTTKHYFVALCEGGALCGYGGFAHIMDEAHIMNIAIDRAYRKLGFGRALLKTLLEEAKSLGVRAVTLEVRENNAAARALYESEGFVLAGIRKDYYGLYAHALIYWLTF
ncbi:MAG: ribosomal protein S18-alanine N-acetyltransferase [Clostridia bacterium]|nr:ribosomal protein S18-alanine N-acetyltransferase [Clostridia bacterium]